MIVYNLSIFNVISKYFRKKKPLKIFKFKRRTSRFMLLFNLVLNCRFNAISQNCRSFLVRFCWSYNFPYDHGDLTPTISTKLSVYTHITNVFILILGGTGNVLMPRCITKVCCWESKHKPNVTIPQLNTLMYLKRSRKYMKRSFSKRITNSPSSFSDDELLIACRLHIPARPPEMMGVGWHWCLESLV